MSLLSWWYIFRKAFVHPRARAARSEDFERTFWSGSDLNSLFQSIVSGAPAAGEHGAHLRGRLSRVREAAQADRRWRWPSVMDGTRRAMRATYQREMDYLDSHLSFLATVGSVSPYVGLLGTVWGIMNAFRGLANVQQATLAHVAPGIAEALIATAIGLFAAIPAVVAFNYYAREIDRLVHPLRDLHGGVLQHPAAAGRRHWADRAPSVLGQSERKAWRVRAPQAHRLMNQINVVPYIDVMLVLLVIFMVTAPLINTSVIELPSVSRSNQPPAAPLEVMIRQGRQHPAARPRARRGRAARRPRRRWCTRSSAMQQRATTISRS